MITRLSRLRVGFGALVAAGIVALGPSNDPRQAGAQAGHDHGPATPPAGNAGGGVRMSAADLHRIGGVPPGWRFAWPAGDPRKGREAFAKLECYQCHEVQGESFPPVAQDPTRRGPALTGMGDHHPAEYFAESVLNPNAVIVTGPGHTGPDGLSIMPDFRDSLTLAEAIDLVAYLRSLTGGDAHAHADAAGAREQVVGDYRVRLGYATHEGEHAHQGHVQPRQGQPSHGPHSPAQPGQAHAGAGRHEHGQAAAPRTAAGHLMVFVSDARRGEPLPYLPVTATIHAVKTPPRAVRLAPMLSDHGFHYGADVTLPAGTTKITVAVGKPALRLAASESGRFGKGVEVSFEWGK